MDNFTIIPAIDLRGGQVVRLSQGNPALETSYGNDPSAWAERWKDEGADWLHVINLNGAFNENAEENLSALRKILEIGLKVEFGGGIRDEKTVRIPLEMGVERIFLGSATINNPNLVKWAVNRYGSSRIAGDIGIHDKEVMIEGWQKSTAQTPLEVGKYLRQQGIKWCVLTNIKRDGVGTGVDVSSAVRLQKETGMHVVASGGVATLDDILRVREAGLAGVIIGRALYEEKFSLRTAMGIIL